MADLSGNALIFGLLGLTLGILFCIIFGFCIKCCLRNWRRDVLRSKEKIITDIAHRHKDAKDKTLVLPGEKVPNGSAGTNDSGASSEPRPTHWMDFNGRDQPIGTLENGAGFYSTKYTATGKTLQPVIPTNAEQRDTRNGVINPSANHTLPERTFIPVNQPVNTPQATVQFGPSSGPGAPNRAVPVNRDVRINGTVVPVTSQPTSWGQSALITHSSSSLHN